MEKVKLVDAIADLRKELYAASQAGKEDPLQLDIEGIEVEFAVEATETNQDGHKIGFNIAVFSVGGDSRDIEAVKHMHRIKLKLSPKLNGGKLPIADIETD